MMFRNCLFFLISVNVFIFPVADAKSITAAGGFYVPVSSQDPNAAIPLIVNKNTETNLWDYNANFEKHLALNVDYYQYTIHLSCLDNICDAFGSNTIPGKQRTQLYMVESLDGGRTWVNNPSIANLPTNFNPTGMIANGGCYASTCFLLDTQLIGKNTPDIPYLLRSEDKGRTWTYIDVGSFFYPKGYGNQIDSIACSDSTCIATGMNFAETVNTLILLVSHDNGETWDNQSTIMYPADYEEMATTANVTYYSHRFHILTSYLDAQKNNRALILNSDDEGKTWHPGSINIETAPDNYQLSLEDIHCNQANCTMFASLYNRLVGNESLMQDLILLSNDNGNTWQINKDAHFPPLDHSWKAPDLYGSVYTDNAYIMVGATTNFYAKSFPYMIESHDNGKSWWPMKLIIPNLQTGQLASVSCDGQDCVALGSYQLKGQKIQQALILESNDQGRTWNVAHLTDLPFETKGVNLLN